MKLLVYKTESSLDAVLIFIKGKQSVKDADRYVFDELALYDHSRVAELEVTGDTDELYALHCYEG